MKPMKKYKPLAVIALLCTAVFVGLGIALGTWIHFNPNKMAVNDFLMSLRQSGSRESEKQSNAEADSLMEYFPKHSEGLSKEFNDLYQKKLFNQWHFGKEYQQDDKAVVQVRLITIDPELFSSENLDTMLGPVFEQEAAQGKSKEDLLLEASNILMEKLESSEPIEVSLQFILNPKNHQILSAQILKE